MQFIIGTPILDGNRSTDILVWPAADNFAVTAQDAGKPEPTLLGRRVRSLRKARHMTQVELAAELDIKQSSLSDIETGVTREVSGKVLAALCRVLRASPDFFMAEDEPSTDWDQLELARQEASFLLGQMAPLTRDAALNAIRGMASQGADRPSNIRPKGRRGFAMTEEKAPDKRDTRRR